MRIFSNGTITWDLPAVIETHCEIDITHYPVDSQICEIELTSWAYNADEINVHSPKDDIDLKELRSNGEWDIIATSHKRQEITECCPQETFIQIKFFITFQRKTLYYVLNVILPVVLLSFLSSIVFGLPCESGEKVSYALTVLLSYAVFLSIITASMPTTSNHVSLLGKSANIRFKILLVLVIVRTHSRCKSTSTWKVWFNIEWNRPVSPVMDYRAQHLRSGASSIRSIFARLDAEITIDTNSVTVSFFSKDYLKCISFRKIQKMYLNDVCQSARRCIEIIECGY